MQATVSLERYLPIYTVLDRELATVGQCIVLEVYLADTNAIEEGEVVSVCVGGGKEVWCLI